MNFSTDFRVGVVILGAGKGTRLGCTDIPKVMKHLAGQPIVQYTVDTLHTCGFGSKDISLVVGFQKEKVMEHFAGRVIFAEQKEQLGTAHAAYVGMRELPQDIEQVLVMGGDDSAFYTCESLEAFIKAHLESQCMLSLLTTEVADPSLLGRVIRTEDGTFDGVMEKEYLNEEQKNIKEISTGTFMFNRTWYERAFPNMPQMKALGEYGLPAAIQMVKEEGCYMQAVKLKKADEWFGINTPAELEEAERRKAQKK